MPPAKKAVPAADVATDPTPATSAGVSEVDKAAAAELAALGLAPIDGSIVTATEAENAEIERLRAELARVEGGHVLSGELQGAICGCFPGGWSGKFAKRSDSVTCQHGTWNRWVEVGE